MMRIVVVVGALLVSLAVGVVAFAYSGLFNVAASANDAGPVRWLLEITRQNAVSRQAADIVVPNLAAEERVAAGANAYAEMCAGCHCAPGRQPVVGAADMNPPPPDLAETVVDRKPGELFWVTKHGIRMTGMPAWGASHTDAQLWEVVALLTRLPDLSPEQFQRLASGAPNDGHDPAHGAPAVPEPVVAPADVGHGHGHGHAH